MQGRLDTFLLITEVTWLLLVYVHFLSKKDDLKSGQKVNFSFPPKAYVGRQKTIIIFLLGTSLSTAHQHMIMTYIYTLTIYGQTLYQQSYVRSSTFPPCYPHQLGH